MNEFVNLVKLRMTCRELWYIDARREIIHLRLTRATSIEFSINNNEFQALVKSRILFPSKQISINFEGTDILGVHQLGCVHALNLIMCRKVKDVSTFGNLHTLHLDFCCGVTDVSALSVHSAMCILLILVDVWELQMSVHFGNVHSLDLSVCDEITDVSAYSAMCIL